MAIVRPFIWQIDEDSNPAIQFWRLAHRPLMLSTLKLETSSVLTLCFPLDTPPRWSLHGRRRRHDLERDVVIQIVTII